MVTTWAAWYWSPARWHWYWFWPGRMTRRHADGTATTCTRAGFNLGPLSVRVDWGHRPATWLR